MNTHSTFGKKKGVALSLACIGLLSAPAAYASTIQVDSSQTTTSRAELDNTKNTAAVIEGTGRAENITVNAGFSGSVNVNANQTLENLIYNQTANSSGSTLANSGLIETLKGTIGVGKNDKTASITNNSIINDATINLNNVVGTLSIANNANARFTDGIVINANSSAFQSGGQLSISNAANGNLGGINLNGVLSFVGKQAANNASGAISNSGNFGGITSNAGSKISLQASSYGANFVITNAANANFGGITDVGIELQGGTNLANQSGALTFTIANSGNFGNLDLANNSIEIHSSGKGSADFLINNAANATFDNIAARSVSVTAGSASATAIISNLGSINNISFDSVFVGTTYNSNAAGDKVSGAYFAIGNQKDIASVSLGNVTISGGTALIANGSGATIRNGLTLDNLTLNRQASSKQDAMFLVKNDGAMGDINLLGTTSLSGVSGAALYIGGNGTFGNITLGDVRIDTTGSKRSTHNFNPNATDSDFAPLSGAVAALNASAQDFGLKNSGGGRVVLDIQRQAGNINIGSVYTNNTSASANGFLLKVNSLANVGSIGVGAVSISGGEVINNISGTTNGNIVFGDINVNNSGKFNKDYDLSTSNKISQSSMNGSFILNVSKGTDGSGGVVNGKVELGNVSIVSGGYAELKVGDGVNIQNGIKVGNVLASVQRSTSATNANFLLSIGNNTQVYNGVQVGDVVVENKAGSAKTYSGAGSISQNASFDNQGTIYGGMSFGAISVKSDHSSSSSNTFFGFKNGSANNSNAKIDTLSFGNFTFSGSDNVSGSLAALVDNFGTIDSVSLQGASGAIGGTKSGGLVFTNAGSIANLNLSGIYNVSGGANSDNSDYVKVNNGITNQNVVGNIGTITLDRTTRFQGKIQNFENGRIDTIINQGIISGAAATDLAQIHNQGTINSIQNIGYTNESGAAIGSVIQSISNIGTIANINNSAKSTISNISVGSGGIAQKGGYIATITNAGTISTLAVNYSGGYADDISSYRLTSTNRDSVNGATIKDLLNTGTISTINVGTATSANGYIHNINNQNLISTISVSGTSTIGTLLNNTGATITSLNNSGAISTLVNNGLIGDNPHIWAGVNPSTDATAASWKSGAMAIYTDPSQSVSVSNGIVGSGARTETLPYAIFTTDVNNNRTAGISGAGVFTSFENTGTIFTTKSGIKLAPARVANETKQQAYFKNSGLIVIGSEQGAQQVAGQNEYRFSGTAVYGISANNNNGVVHVENTGKILLDSVKSAQIQAPTSGTIQVDRWDLTLNKSTAAFNYLGKDKTYTIDGKTYTYNQGNLTWSGSTTTSGSTTIERNWAYSGSNTLDLSTGLQADIQQLNAMTSSHIIVSGGANLNNIKFGVGSIRLNLGRDFEAGKVYKLSNLVLENNGGTLTPAGNVASGSVSVASGSLTRTYGNLQNTASTSQVSGVNADGTEKRGLSVYNLSVPNAMFVIQEARWDSTQQNVVVNKNAAETNKEPEWISVDVLGNQGNPYSGGETGTWSEGFVYGLNPSAGRGAETAQITLAAAQRRSSFINSVLSNAINQSQAATRRFVNAELNRYALVEDADFSLSNLDHYAAPRTTNRALNTTPAQRQVAQNINSHVFVMPYYTKDEVKFDAGGKSKGDIYGIILGYQRNLGGANGTAGVFAGYENAKNKNSAHNGWQDETQKDDTFFVGANYYTNVYESNLANVFAKGLVKIATTKSKFDTANDSANHLSWGLEAGVGANIYLNTIHTITPEAALSFDSTRIGGFDDRDLGVSYEKTNLNLLVARLGVSWTANWIEKLSTDLGAGIKYNTKKNVSVDASANGSRSYSSEIKLPQTYTYVTASVAYKIAPNTELSLTYNGDFSNKSNTHSGYLRVGYWW